MSTLRRCNPCGRLTTLSLCPHCGIHTVHYAATLKDVIRLVDGSDLTSSAAHTPLTDLPLTITDIDALAMQGITVSADTILSAERDVTTRSVAELEAILSSLRRENDGLRKKLQCSRRQILRSAMDVRDLHASYKQMRQESLNHIDELNRENMRLKTMLQAQNSNNEPVNVPLLQQPTPTAADAHLPSSPHLTSSPRVSVVSQSMEEDIPGLNAEVVSLRSALALKTQHLDDLWERAERAEHCVEDLLRRLELTKNIVRNESSNSIRLSRHLESVGRPPEDIVSFMAQRDS
ncbi:hypothetical protein JKF63_02748 [Porcisia hertigi]|uniref:Uncharacterized protein n=1 Tax=Porcisia hertigi TaxID=2761500 RepID=A0A836L2N7_9TRYP|nr:hypothetical protein JKF63_02748 [Porcisia hertigi]